MADSKSWTQRAYSDVTQVDNHRLADLRHASYGLLTVLGLLVDDSASEPADQLAPDTRAGLVSAALICANEVQTFCEDHEKAESAMRVAHGCLPAERNAGAALS